MTIMQCTDPLHSSRIDEPGWSDNLGETSLDETPQGTFCGACGPLQTPPIQLPDSTVAGQVMVQYVVDHAGDLWNALKNMSHANTAYPIAQVITHAALEAAIAGGMIAE